MSNFNNPYANNYNQFMNDFQNQANKLQQDYMNNLNALKQQFSQSQFNPNYNPNNIPANIQNPAPAPVQEIPPHVQILSVLGEIRTSMNEMLSIWKVDKPASEEQEIETDVKQIKKK